MGLNKFATTLDLLKGYIVNLYVGEEEYKGKLIGVEADHIILENENNYIFYYSIDQIQAITKNTKQFQGEGTTSSFLKTQSLVEVLNSFKQSWVTILCLNKQKFNGVLSEVDEDFATLINGEERILIKLTHISNILKGYIKEKENEEESKDDEKQEAASTQVLSEAYRYPETLIETVNNEVGEDYLSDKQVMKNETDEIYEASNNVVKNETDEIYEASNNVVKNETGEIYEASNNVVKNETNEIYEAPINVVKNETNEIYEAPINVVKNETDEISEAPTNEVKNKKDEISKTSIKVIKNEKDEIVEASIKVINNDNDKQTKVWSQSIREGKEKLKEAAPQKSINEMKKQNANESQQHSKKIEKQKDIYRKQTTVIENSTSRQVGEKQKNQVKENKGTKDVKVSQKQEVINPVNKIKDIKPTAAPVQQASDKKTVPQNQKEDARQKEQPTRAFRFAGEPVASREIEKSSIFSGWPNPNRRNKSLF